MSDDASQKSPPKLRLDALLPPETEEILAFRLLKRSMGYMAGVVGLVGAIFGYAGYDVLKQLERTQQTLADQVTITVRAAEAQQREIHDRLEKVAQLKEEITKGLEHLEKQSQSYDDLFRRELKGRGASEEKIREQLAKADGAVGQVNSRVKEFDKLREDINATAVTTGKTVATLQNTVTGMTGKVDTIEERILGSGSFVVKEKMSTQQELSGMDIFVRLAFIRKDRLIQFEVLDKNLVTVWGPKDLQWGRGSGIEFEANGNHYSLRPTYVLEFVGKDAAGLDVRKSRPPSVTLHSESLVREP